MVTALPDVALIIGVGGCRLISKKSTMDMKLKSRPICHHQVLSIK